MGINAYDFWLFSSYASTTSLGGVQQHIAQKDSEQDTQWISTVSEFAQSGLLQGTILAVSVTWAVLHLVFYRQKTGRRVQSKASSVRWPYEVTSQVARIASVAFSINACIQGQCRVVDVVVLGYGLFLGLLRLINDINWRHVALHQVNFVYTAMLLVVTAGQFLPCIQINGQFDRDASVVGIILALASGFIAAILTPREWVPPQMDIDIPGYTMSDVPAPEEICSWFNYYCSYEWMTPIIWKGTRGILDMSGIPRLAWYDEPLYVLKKVQAARSISKRTLWTALRFQQRELSLMSVWIALTYLAENISPYGMFKLLNYLAQPKEATYQPWLWLLLIFLGPISRSLLFQQYIFVSTRLIVRIKSAMTQELYQRALESMELEDDPFGLQKDEKKKNSQQTTSAGRLANLMASDVEAIYKARDVVINVIGVPLGTIVSLVGMYRMMGWPALAGTAVIILTTPLSVWLGRFMYHKQREVRQAQDARISLVTEYLSSIRAIKYFAWEKPIMRKINASRAVEQRRLWHVAVLQATINQVGQVFPYVALLLMFGLHVGLEKKRLDASVAFTTVFLVKNIRRNIMQASYFARSFASAMVSFGRLDKYFESTVPLVKYPEGPLRMENAAFRRNKKATFQLENISLEFAQGGLNVVSGQSGSGKTTLLLAILGETYCQGGIVTRPRDVAFASQSTWLQNDTIQANVFFGSSMDLARYDRVIEACCLSVDFKELSDGDMTVVGENGTSLSGGQKARVALARALYSSAPLLLLDDVFSALDAKTSAGVWKYCFCSDLLKGRTTVLVTQIPWIAEQSDMAVTLANGRIQDLETNIGVVRRPITIAKVMGGTADEQPEPELLPKSDSLNDNAKAVDDHVPKDIVDEEMKASGKVNRLTFLQYMSHFGSPIFTIICLTLLVATNIVGFLSGYWLVVWVEAYDQKAHVDIPFYMGIYGFLAFLEIGSYGAIIVMFEWGAWHAARKLHRDFINSVMHVSLSWFKVIPIGRITNRFSADMAAIDGWLSNLLRMTLDNIVQLLFRIIAVSGIMPIFMVPALFTCIFGIIIGELYTRTAVIVKRLTSSAQSPVFSQFADTLAGLPVIRARADMPQAFREDLASKLRIWSAAAETGFICNRWVAVRVDFITALVALSAGIIAVSKAGSVSAGLVGFSLSTANGLSQTILMFVRAMNDLEVEMQSFHRVREYVKLDHEEKDDKPFPSEGAYADDSTQIVPRSWPRSGEIEFRNVTIRYDTEGPNILTDVNLKFRAGERLAVVGRTGSGKSTLILSLLRFTHIVAGQILYDGVDITKVSRVSLREGLTIIPQEAVLFNGTVRSNLDPTGLLPIEVLEQALENCKGIASFSSTELSPDTPEQAAQGITLETPVNAKGENFSHGQRQVLSLCRALIRRSKLMLLDEATASMDYETDRGIQTVLRNDLEAAGGGRTLVTIAHRLRTIIDYDSVIVMSGGRVAEHGSPKALYEARGHFYDMVQHSGEVEDLQSHLEG